jgi:hypothetical protein
MTLHALHATNLRPYHERHSSHLLSAYRTKTRASDDEHYGQSRKGDVPLHRNAPNLIKNHFKRGSSHTQSL